MNAREFLMQLLYDIDIEKFIYNYYSKMLSKGWSMHNAHSHRALEILCVINGVGYFKFTNDIVKISKNDVLIIAPGCYHRLYIENNDICELVCVQFNLEVLKQGDIKTENSLFPEFSILRERNSVKIPGNKLMRDCMKRIVVEMDQKKENFTSLVKSELTNLLIHICRTLKELEKNNIGIKNQHISLAVDFINKSLETKLKPQDIADAVHISSHYLMHLFRDNMGNSLMRYVTMQRIERSKKLLIHTNESITEISGMVGFETLQYFSLQFKKLTGLSPKQYRKISQAADLLHIGENQ